jgi:hypothetical protein
MKRHKNRVDIERRVRQIAWPEPTPDLRDRILSAAPVVKRRVTWSDRVWFSRAWRLAAAATVVGVIGLDVLSDTRGVARFSPGAHALAEAQLIADTGRDIGLPADVASSLARRVLAAAPRAAEDLQSRLAFQALESEGRRR